jgi:hypothetical protein
MLINDKYMAQMYKLISRASVNTKLKKTFLYKITGKYNKIKNLKR